MKEKVLVILPAYNEAQTLGAVLDSIGSMGYKTFVIDNNSTDSTMEEASKRGVAYLFTREQGKGCAIREGLFGIPPETQVVMLDADGTYPTLHIPEVLEKLTSYDVVLGRRWRKDKGAMSLTNRIGNRLLSLLASVLYHRKVRDLCTGMWAFSPLAIRVLKDAPLRSRGFTLEAEMFSVLSRAGLTIGEVPITYKPREGESKLRLIDGLKIGLCLVVRRIW